MGTPCTEKAVTPTLLYVQPEGINGCRREQKTRRRYYRIEKLTARVDRQNLDHAYTEPKTKTIEENGLTVLILLVPLNGIEPLPDDYKSTARPSCYGGSLC